MACPYRGARHDFFAAEGRIFAGERSVLLKFLILGGLNRDVFGCNRLFY